MNLDLTKLNNGSLSIEQPINLPPTYLLTTDIHELKNTKISAIVSYAEEDEILIDGVITGTMVLTDAYSLEEVDYDFEANIEETINLNELKVNKIIKKSENILDITDILWQNIVLEVPISYSVTNTVTKQSGEGWELKDKETKEVDPRLAKLAELLEKGKE